MSRLPRLIVVEPSGTRREMAVTPQPFRIGRQQGNELTLRDSRISRQQAQITSANGSVVLEDMGSRHGTIVNGQKVLRHELKPQDKIEFGIPDSYQLIYLGQDATLGELLERADMPAAGKSSSRELYHLGVLLEVARTLGTGLSLEEVLTAVVDAAIQVTGTERGLLLLAKPDGELTTAVARDARRGTLRPEDLQISSSVLKRVVSSRRELIVTDMGEDANIQQQASVARLQLHTVVAIPVDKLPVIESLDATISTRQGELLGVLYMDSHSPSSAFSELDREVLRNLAREAATVIENARLFASSRDKARLDHEIEIASQIQRQLLPASFPKTAHFEVMGTTLACLSVGGDCFDVIELTGDRCGFFVGDVSGKGISAALLATLLQGTFYTTAMLDVTPGETATRVNAYLCKRSSEERYATLFYSVLSPDGHLEYVNAGHVSPMVRRASGEVEELPASGVPVGMFEGTEYTPSSARLRAGDFMVIFTDGVSEAVSQKGDMFGEERLRELLRNFSGENVQDLVAAINEELRVFTIGANQADDITLIVVQFKG
jgi:sigma-B regulation protein RsbU (phosphoserine phosphatase)